MSATVFLVRHGSHAEVGHRLSGQSDIALSAAGRAEASALAGRLAATPLTAIHSSPRRRARETAEIVAARHDLAVEIVGALDEIDFGAWAGCSFDELADRPDWRRWNAERGTAATPAGDDMAKVTDRAVRHLEQAATDAGPLLCVSHCDVIRALLAHYLGLSADRLLSFDIDPASLSTLAVGGGSGRVISLNERAA